MSKPEPFERVWTLEDTQRALAAPPFPSNAPADEQHRWRQEIGNPANEKLALACGRHVSWLMTHGLAQEPAHIEHAQARFLTAMRQLRNQPESEEWQLEVGRPFSILLDMFLFRMPNDPSPDPGAIHDRMQKAMAEGNFRDVLGEPQTCRVSGLRLVVKTEGWQFACGTRQWPENDRSIHARPRFVDIQQGDIQPATLQHATIPVPSGQLLVADWFCLPAFNELARPVDDDEPGEALESTHGRAQRTHRYASDLGVAHVFGRSPAVLASQDVVRVGYLHADAEREPPSLAGHIQADLRWTTIVDRQHLESLLASRLGQVEAAMQVDALVKESCGLIQLKVEPGIHHLYFSGDAHSFDASIHQTMDASALALEEFEQPLFVLTQQPLAPRVAIRRKPST